MQVSSYRPGTVRQTSPNTRFGVNQTRTRTQQPVSQQQESVNQQQKVQTSHITKEQLAQLAKLSELQSRILQQLDSSKQVKLTAELNQQIEQARHQHQVFESQFQGKSTTAEPNQIEQIKQAIQNQARIDHKQLQLTLNDCQQRLQSVSAAPPPPPMVVAAASGSPPPPPPSEGGDVPPEEPSVSPVADVESPSPTSEETPENEPPKRSRGDLFKLLFSPKALLKTAIFDALFGTAIGAIIAIGSPVMAVTVPVSIAICVGSDMVLKAGLAAFANPNADRFKNAFEERDKNNQPQEAKNAEESSSSS